MFYILVMLDILVGLGFLYRGMTERTPVIAVVAPNP